MVGTTIAHYRLEQELGRGGMGVVFRARDTRLNRTVAIKFLTALDTSDRARRRFRQEAETASAINHPHLASVYDIGVEDDRAYLVGEYIDGVTLREWARREHPSWRQAVELMVGIADALTCVHAAGIVHRDIKPENILVATQGYAKLLDFGIAKLLDPAIAEESDVAPEAVPPTRTGTIIGTVPYMAPEQIRGERVDARADIFAFGVVLFELLAGRRPFGREGNTAAQTTPQSEPSLRSVRPQVPYALQLIVEKALESDRADRYQSMRELVVDLRRLLRRPQEQAADANAGARRTPRYVYLPIAAGVILLAGILAMRAWRPTGQTMWRNPLAEGTFTRLTDFAGLEVDATISPDGKFVAFLSDRDGPVDAWITQVGSGAFVNLTKGQFPELLHEEMQSLGFTPDGTHVWLRITEGNQTWLVPALGGTPRPFLNVGINPVWSPDGRRLAYSEAAPERGEPIVMADAHGGNPQQFFAGPPGTHHHFLAWSRYSPHLFFTNPLPPNDIWRIPVSGGDPERMTHHQTRVTHATPIDERTLLYIALAEDGSGSWLYGMDLDERVPHRLNVGVEHYLSLSADDTGRRLVATVANPSGTLWTVPIASGVSDESAVRPFPVPTVRATNPRIGQDEIFFLSSRGAAPGLWKLKDGNAAELWRGRDGWVPDAPALSADRRTLAVPIRRKGRTTLHLMTQDGTDVRAVGSTIDVRGGASWSPDGEWIAVAGDAGSGLKLFKVPLRGGEPVVLVDEPSYNPAWSPDGGVVLYEHAPGGTGRVLKAVRPDGQAVNLPRIHTRRGADRARFLPGGQTAAVLIGQYRRQDFWLLDVRSGSLRQLTNFRPGYSIKGFDVSPDGRQLIFDRFTENSDIVLIERSDTEGSAR